MLLIENFLTAIDHINYHSSQVQNTTRTKRSEDYAVQGYYHSCTRILTPSEENRFGQSSNSFTENQSLPSSTSGLERK